ncbi:hypothetical protein CCC_02935 [Paramagnetospirillum magnetotacticum MS-1]|uniref:Methyl-accepting chemotaxis protein n=1 Tax=Paramagnetospirillum magnetotacticum MS-1 TaxID=272627 RepID=A0A0C2V517_PARME|nr:hypothetical protein [Paramagnetospirillum magnetotacticum]KIM00147.1 hypothetical protein CCC_02935 [Paramagnetospirillum magnetotacticum MS-1]
MLTAEELKPVINAHTAAVVKALTTVVTDTLTMGAASVAGQDQTAIAAQVRQSEQALGHAIETMRLGILRAVFCNPEADHG